MATILDKINRLVDWSHETVSSIVINMNYAYKSEICERHGADSSKQLELMLTKLSKIPEKLNCSRTTFMTNRRVDLVKEFKYLSHDLQRKYSSNVYDQPWHMDPLTNKLTRNEERAMRGISLWNRKRKLKLAADGKKQEQMEIWKNAHLHPHNECVSRKALTFVFKLKLYTIFNIKTPQYSFLSVLWNRHGANSYAAFFSNNRQ